jgi:hypothetical protein
MSEIKTVEVVWSDVEHLVKKHYRGELSDSIKAALAVVASLSLKERDHCLVLVFEGGAGQGKSIIVRSLMPDRVGTEKFLQRVDDFTPASFVSHASNRTKEELEGNDLLPQLKDKVMLTKELAPLFRDDDRELRQNFARLTSVLDGDGYKTHSGVHGGRGYTGRYIFHWVGATTPIPDRTHKVMAQLGNRILFHEVAGEEPSEKDLLEFAKSYGANGAVKQCAKAVNDFIEQHFNRNPSESVDPESIKIPEPLLLEIIHYAQLIAAGRVEVNIAPNGGEVEAGTPEGAYRVVLLLQTLARGLALVERHSEVTKDDLDVIRHVALSSIPTRRRELLRALLAAGGTMDAGQVESALDCSRPTALDRMKELGTTGICKFTPGNPKTSTPAVITLNPEWEWLKDAASPPSDRSGPSEPSEETLEVVEA